MKLGVSYNLFNGEELLEASIRSIRKQVDYINIVWQNKSWTNEPANPKLKLLLNDLIKEGLVDNLIEYDFDKVVDPWKMAIKKKNIGIGDLRAAGCTHFLLMDADEFYIEEEFEKAKKFILENRITHSACPIYDYRPSYCYRMRDVQSYSVSFICKLNRRTKITGRNSMPCLIDSLRTAAFCPFVHKFYYFNNVAMHHMTGVRRNYKSKLDNTISNYSESGKEAIKVNMSLQEKLESMTEDEILASGYIKVEDRFEIEKWMSKNEK